jgi:hypothetical protein
MLALSDEALARLAIGATRVRASERGKWLQDVARKLDLRQPRWRAARTRRAASGHP